MSCTSLLSAMWKSNPTDQNRGGVSAPVADWRVTDVNVISRQRSGIFGVVILWIMLFHSSVNLKWLPLHLIKSTGYAGVDVFFFLSGVGLFYSMEKDPSPLHFYKKRAVRVILPFLLVALVYEGTRFLMGEITAGAFLSNVTLVSYWRNGTATYWFIAAILVLYLVYPLLYRIVKRRHYAVQVLLLLGAFALACFLYPNGVLFYRYAGFVFRLPIILLGCFLAPVVKEGRQLPTIPTVVITFIVACGCFLLWGVCGGDWWFLRMYIFIPLSLSLILLGSVVLSFIPKETILQRGLLFLGGMTLELYLVHEKLLALLSGLLPQWNLWGLNGLAVAFSIAVAWCLRKLCDQISRKIL